MIKGFNLAEVVRQVQDNLNQVVLHNPSYLSVIYPIYL